MTKKILMAVLVGASLFIGIIIIFLVRDFMAYIKGVSRWKDVANNIETTASLAIANKDPALCTQFAVQQNIYFSSKESHEFLGEVDPYPVRAACLEKYYTTTLDAQACELLVDEDRSAPHIRNKSMCYRNIAMAKSDSSLCEKINEPNLAVHCRALIALDPALCQQINPDPNFVEFPTRDQHCITPIAVKLKDYTVCLKIDNEELYGKHWQSTKGYCLIDVFKEKHPNMELPESEKWICDHINYKENVPNKACH